MGRETTETHPLQTRFQKYAPLIVVFCLGDPFSSGKSYEFQSAELFSLSTEEIFVKEDTTFSSHTPKHFVDYDCLFALCFVFTTCIT